jgi:metallophosphoesterase (TIGR03767 family)
MADDEQPDEVEGTLSRRAVLGAGLVGGAAIGGGAVDPASAHGGPGSGKGTTLRRTLLRGSPGPGGYRKIVVGPGEPHLVRHDLMAAARGRHSGRRRRAVLALGQLTDLHLMDTQSPARVEFLDRYNDPDSPFAPFLPFQSSYRAQEMLTPHVAEATVRALRAVRRGPVTGLPLAFAITTGDNVDNTQLNELRWQIDLLDGVPIRPDSGDLTKYEGVADQVAFHPRYWHPDGPPAGSSPDLPTSQFGFPTLPGLLDACRTPFATTGIGMPWLTVFGNHDGLVQGNVPSSPPIVGLATGPAKIIDLPPGTDILLLAQQLQSGDPQGLATLFSGPFRLVTPDPDRRPLSRTETIAEHFHTSGRPHGHGYSAWNLATGKAYYRFDRGQVRGIVLDTVNPFGGSEGSIDAEQLAWLTAQLEAGSRRYLDESGHVVRGGRHDRLFVIFSHHTIGSMNNATGVGRVLGPAVRDLLLRFPNVVLWVNGHTHRNTVIPHKRPAGSPAQGGFWEVNTAAHVDWPQQARTIEIVDNRNGSLSVFGTLVDHAGPTSYGSRPTTPLQLASLSRELAANDWQERTSPPGQDGRRGRVEDRNVELLLPAPFDLGHHS